MPAKTELGLVRELCLLMIRRGLSIFELLRKMDGGVKWGEGRGAEQEMSRERRGAETRRAE